METNHLFKLIFSAVFLALLTVSCNKDDSGNHDKPDPTEDGSAKVFDIFKEINTVPRPSNKEEKMRVYLRKFAADRNLELREINGDIAIYKPASAGKENVPMLNLQTHMDMVCVAAEGYQIDFLNQGIEQYNDGTYIWSKDKKTSLGADDGAGMAVVLAILDNKDLEHGPLECLFTYAEESDFEGVNSLPAGWLKAKYMINLDGENDEETIIGTAGGVRATIGVSYTAASTPAGYKAMSLTAKNMAGGHSGLAIDNKGCNAIQLMGQFLYGLKVPYLLATINGGVADNVIAQETTSVVLVKEDQVEALKTAFNNYMEEKADFFAETDPDFTYTIADCDMPSSCVPDDAAKLLIEGLATQPYGVLEEGTIVPGLFELSSNIGVIKTGDNRIEINNMIRGFNTDKMDAAETAVEEAYLVEQGKASVKITSKFNAWNCDLDASLLTCARNTYAGLFGKELRLSRVGGGLEASVLAELYPDMQVINLGITTYDVHSINEHVEVESMKKMWKCMTSILAAFK